VPETLDVARAVCDADTIQAELAVVVRPDLKGRGLGYLLLDKLIRYCRERGVKRIVGQTLPRNTLMLQLAKGMEFREEFQAEEKTVALSLELQ
jgi:acetyltransferase